ncbi:ABC transporter ATP-binding protein [Clostridium sporogenes]|uniref:ABC transporter ATP-binding protein n=2 Tax=Clostridium TaxID=1485 RepID=A0A7X5PCR3_CLOSG|nr:MULTISPECIES: ABC transporter ATP-binding protein [Clostridium]AJD32304.1 ABC transporter family protein [Clostridium botulinum Prevot_594]AVP60747.1 ABC transporter ATP-binding protein [Clostridium botulinum]AKC61007.1 bacitracin export ATP-binding protein BceA [Clostridium sporogenes]AKJ88362.1 bacitracin ABC transporter ATP-binding protein [Clostridium sporogenes]AVP62885.1 ABC transporter ATP-binding protein [Clostridium botulinum]
MKKIVEISKLIKDYGRLTNQYKVLKGIDLEINEGEFISIMGPSGSGKTTLLNIMSTIDKATSGMVIIDSKDVNSLREDELARFRRDVIGFVFQDFNLLDSMTIRDNIALPLTLNSEKTEIILERINKLTKLLGIEKHLDKYPYQLSGGQKQRAAICRALITSPKVIFADEPTGALDSKSSVEVLECFTNINKSYNTTIVMVTHDARAASYADRIMFLKDGSISGELYSNGNKSEMFKKILNMIAVMGGESNELI